MDCHQVFVVLLLSSTFVTELEGKQTFQSKPQYTEINPKETVILNCRISNIEGQCSWQKDRKPIKLYSQKYEWNGSPDQGDCSLKIIDASLVYDDGIWECQVTPSSFDKMDALSSEPAKLVVRVAPKEPIIEHNSSHLVRGGNLTTRANESTVVKCISRYGNPAASISWFLDDVNITAYSIQSDSAEPDNQQTSIAVSVLDHVFTRVENGKLLRCLAFHEAYQHKSKEISVRLNVQYPPVTTLYGKPRRELEENKDSLTLQCRADANPSAYITWKKDGVDQQFADKIEFSPLKRVHTGMYMCEARNSLGRSITTPTVEIDVKYPPKIKDVTPRRVSVVLSNRTALSCKAEGNPPPKYQWLHSMTGNPETAVIVKETQILILSNITYDNQGKYVCVASNVINSEERKTQSHEVTVEVYGPPQVLGIGSPKGEILADKGLDATIHIAFCSKPKPSKINWEWGSLLLAAGEDVGNKFVAKPVIEMKDVKGCYEAELVIQKAETSDSRRYMLKVENSYGHIDHAVFLNVQEPIAMLTLIGIVIGCLVLLVIIILIVLYAFRSEKWCFQKKDVFSTKVVESEVDGKDNLGDARSCNTGAIPPDALYTIPPKSKSERSDDVSEYDSMMSDHNNPKSGGNQEVVYADLDLLHSKAPSKQKIIRRESPTEYAQIQVQYRPKPNEQADI